MAITYADRVKDTSTTTGTGPFTVSGTAPTGFQTFDDKFGGGGYTSNNQFPVTVDGGANWVTGYGHLSDAVTVVIDTITDSSNGGSAVTFPAGIKDVYADVPAAFFNGTLAWTKVKTVDFTEWNTAIGAGALDVVEFPTGTIIHDVVAISSDDFDDSADPIELGPWGWNMTSAFAKYGLFIKGSLLKNVSSTTPGVLPIYRNADASLGKYAGPPAIVTDGATAGMFQGIFDYGIGNGDATAGSIDIWVLKQDQ